MIEAGAVKLIDWSAKVEPVPEIEDFRPKTTEALNRHVQKYKGFTLSNDWSYSWQIEWIDHYGGLPPTCKPDYSLVNSTAPNKKENNMQYIEQNVAFTEKKAISEVLRRFLDRVDNVYNKHNESLGKKFHIDAYFPNTIGEMLTLIKKGEYTLEEEVEEEDSYNPYAPIVNFLTFKTKKPDRKGFKAATEELSQAYNLVRDKLYLYVGKDGSEEKVLEIIKDFENWKL